MVTTGRDGSVTMAAVALDASAPESAPNSVEPCRHLAHFSAMEAQFAVRDALQFAARTSSPQQTVRVLELAATKVVSVDGLGG